MNFFKNHIAELEAANARIAELETHDFAAENESLRAEKIAADELAATYQAELEVARMKLEENESLRLSLESALEEEKAKILDFETAVAAATAAQIAALGHEAVDTTEDDENAVETFKTLKPSEIAAYYKEHRAKLWKH